MDIFEFIRVVFEVVELVFACFRAFYEFVGP